MMAPLAPRVEEVPERGLRPDAPNVGRVVLEDDVVPVLFPVEVLRHEEPHLRGDTDAAEVGDVDRQAELTVERPK
eukprot:8958886-Alexandrium_andersonii.AAC.1